METKTHRKTHPKTGTPEKEVKPSTIDLQLPNRKEPVTIVFNAAEITVPKPSSKGQKRIDVRLVERHPEQPRMEGGSESVDEALVLRHMGRHGPLEPGVVPAIGQDSRLALPIVASHNGKLTWLAGHRRAKLVEWLFMQAASFAEQVFPGHTLLVDMREIDPTSPEALAILDDHTQKDERRQLLIVELYDRIETVREANKHLPEKIVRSVLIQRFGKETVDKLGRINKLPGKVLDTMRESAKKTGKDAFTWSQINDLYKVAQDHATGIAEETERNRLRDQLTAEGKSEKEIKASLAGVKIENTGKPLPIKDNPGEEFETAYSLICEGKAPVKLTSLNRGKVNDLIKTLGLSTTKAQFGPLANVLTAIADGNFDNARKAALKLLGVEEAKA